MTKYNIPQILAVGILSLLIICLSIHCARNLRPDNEQEMRLLIEKIHSTGHRIDMSTLTETALRIGEDAVIPLFEMLAKRDCVPFRNDCRRYAMCGLLVLARDSKDINTRRNVSLVIEKKILESRDTQYVLDLLDIISPAYTVKDSNGQWVHRMPIPHIITALKQLLHHSDYLDSAVQFRALHVLNNLLEIEVSPEVKRDILFDSLSSKKPYVRYNALRDIEREGYIIPPQIQDALYVLLDKEDDPGVRKKIIEFMIRHFALLDKRVVLRLIDVAETSIEIGKIDSGIEASGIMGGIMDDVWPAFYQFDDSLGFLTKLTGLNFGEVKHDSKIEAKREVVKKWREWWENNRNSLKWNPFYRKYFPQGEK